MKLQFKKQIFQDDAVNAVCDIFTGQPFSRPTFIADQGRIGDVYPITRTGFYNSPILQNVNLLANLQSVQKENNIPLSQSLEGNNASDINLTVEMETGTGKTYVYIKTMYELNKRYGWSRFIIVVPSVAIREGVYKTFQITQEHFKAQYGRQIRYFIYNSKKLTQIENFVSNDGINAMIINSQAFNASGTKRIINDEVEQFKFHKPIDTIAGVSPILIIDEPQSVEGKKTKEMLALFKPLFTLRYSATPKDEYNVVYRLDAIDAYNRKLVKKIEVAGISSSGTTGTEGYIYLSEIKLSKNKAPVAKMEIEVKGKSGIRAKTITAKINDSLFELSQELEIYHGYDVIHIDPVNDYVEFANGIKIYSGHIYGSQEKIRYIRRIQILETIKAHLEKEKILFLKGIKTLSLFFIDKVENYRVYNKDETAENGEYATIFEEEYNNAVEEILKQEDLPENYRKYLENIKAEETHEGYFSKDKKTGRIKDSEVKKKETISDDIDAYELIMKDKEALLSLEDNQKAKVRFIFSHSALREGWDNPNVFQICMLKESDATTRKRQEIGRGLRLSVNSKGERQDEQSIGQAVHEINVLTVIASESYEDFTQGLQKEISEDSYNRPVSINTDTFKNQSIQNSIGQKKTVDESLSRKIYNILIKKDYLNDDGKITEKYEQDRLNGNLNFGDLQEYSESIVQLIDEITRQQIKIENARAKNVELKADSKKLASKEFNELWEKINSKSYYTVKFESEELIKKATEALDKGLFITETTIKVKKGQLGEINTEQLDRGESFVSDLNSSKTYHAPLSPSQNIRYDLIGKIVENTGITRADTVAILQKVKPETFEKFKQNPEEFILKASKIINEQKSAAVIEHISYTPLQDRYETAIFTENSIKGQLGKNAMPSKKHLYDYLKYDSSNEKKFAEQLEQQNDVKIYIKLPRGFTIPTPLGEYNPDWAIVFNEGTVRHIYFVAETKGTMNTMELRGTEKAKIECAKKHFESISHDNVEYGVISNYDELLNLVKQ